METHGVGVYGLTHNELTHSTSHELNRTTSTASARYYTSSGLTLLYITRRATKCRCTCTVGFSRSSCGE